ncbi:MAG TPA: hypothetical protein VFE33_23615 [Thermoanaerobaculia bacterium]|nr:hypothetical protein [Thermoanaerobaculia bacterium]
MSKENTYSGKLGDWQRLLAPIAANAADLPHLATSSAQLETLLAEGLVATKAQAVHVAAKQDLSKQVRGVITEGERLATLLRQAIKQHYGIRAEKLSEFGIQPFRGRKGKKDNPETPPPPTTTPPPPVELKAPADHPVTK